MKYSQEEIDRMKELGYSYSTAFDGVFIKLEAIEDTNTQTDVWREEQRNREARTGVSTSRKSQMMKPDNCNHPYTQTIADCWVEERNDAGMNCYECEECGILLEKHPSCDVHYDS